LSLFVREAKYAMSTKVLRLFRPIIFALLVLALPISSVSAAAIRANLTPPEVRQMVQQAIQTLKPALYTPVKQTLPSTLQLGLDKGLLNANEYAQFYKVFVEGKAPANQPEIAHMLSLPADQQVAYSLQRLQQMGKLSAQEVELINTLLATPDDKVREKAVAALESGSNGLLATAILQVAVTLTNIDISKGLYACDSTASSLQAQGWLGDALKWLGGLVLETLEGAVKGAFFGLAFGNPTAGAIWGGIGGAVKYISDTTGGNGFMPGPNGEGCTSWPGPRPF
jgi:hypothetical protein